MRAHVRSRATAPVNGTEAAARVADVLVAVGAHPGAVGITELSEHLGLGKSVVHRILQTLQDRMLVGAAPGRPGRYTLGPVAAGWGSLPTLRADLAAAAVPALWSVLQASRHTVTVSLLTGVRRCYVGQLAVGGLAVRMDRLLPLHAGAPGKAILAFVPEDVHDRVLEGGLRAGAGRAPTDPQVLAEHLSRVRRTQVAVALGEVDPDVGGVAAPVFAAGEVVGAIGVCLPVTLLTTSRADLLADVVRSAARQVSATMDRRG